MRREEGRSPQFTQVVGDKPRGACHPTVSLMPGGAHGDSELTSLENEDHKGSQELA